MKFFIDNNLSKNLARGMRAFGEEVEHLQDYYDEDTPDEVWLEYIGQKGMFLITRDEGIRHNPAELSALRKYKVGAFFLGGKGLNRCHLIRQLVRNWPHIKKHSQTANLPFAFRIPPKGKKITRIF